MKRSTDKQLRPFGAYLEEDQILFLKEKSSQTGRSISEIIRGYIAEDRKTKGRHDGRPLQ